MSCAGEVSETADRGSKAMAWCECTDDAVGLQVDDTLRCVWPCTDAVKGLVKIGLGGTGRFCGTGACIGPLGENGG